MPIGRGGSNPLLRTNERSEYCGQRKPTAWLAREDLKGLSLSNKPKRSVGEVRCETRTESVRFKSSPAHKFESAKICGRKKSNQFCFS